MVAQLLSMQCNTLSVHAYGEKRNLWCVQPCGNTATTGTSQAEQCTELYGIFQGGPVQISIKCRPQSNTSPQANPTQILDTLLHFSHHHGTGPSLKCSPTTLSATFDTHVSITLHFLSDTPSHACMHSRQIGATPVADVGNGCSAAVRLS
jgi:hypothetical protein